MSEHTSRNPVKKCWTDGERLELMNKLDAELENYMNRLEKKPYNEGWPEDRWQEEMEKHPFFMKSPPNPEEELSPLIEGLQQLKYSIEENTPEELANNYKEDGNFNFKYKKYHLAIISYTEGIKTKCEDKEIMAQLYNNRAAAHFILGNYRSSSNDCEQAIQLKPGYLKALKRAASCCFELRNYSKCIEFCDVILEWNPKDEAINKLRSSAVIERKRAERDARKKEIIERKSNKCEEKILQVIKNRNIRLESKGGEEIVDLKSLTPQVPEIAHNIVHLDENERLIWPVMILYPEVYQTDYIQNFHEDSTLEEHLQELFRESPPWDVDRKYNVDSINVYFEGNHRMNLNRVDIHKTLGEILHVERFVVREGTPTFLVLLSKSGVEEHLLSMY